MPSLQMDIPHNLPQEEALSRIKNLLTKVREEHQDKISNLKEDWTSETGNFEFNALGFDLSGMINVQPSLVHIDAKIPLAVSLFKGKITELIEKKAKELLS